MCYTSKVMQHSAQPSLLEQFPDQTAINTEFFGIVTNHMALEEGTSQPVPQREVLQHGEDVVDIQVNEAAAALAGIELMRISLLLKDSNPEFSKNVFGLAAINYYRNDFLAAHNYQMRQEEVERMARDDEEKKVVATKKKSSKDSLLTV